jgi:deoxyadenosine/deoxycytidine kinase
MGNVDERDYQSYQRVFNLVTSQLPPPDLLIYLKAPVPVLMNRIHSRARSIETGITSEYLSLLESFYDDWMKIYDVCPVITISSDDLDFVHKPQHLDVVVQRIQDRFMGKEELEFPAS